MYYPIKDVIIMQTTKSCLIVIGNEILSGRTQDENIRFIGSSLGEIGISLAEVRVIPDVTATIVTTVNQCRSAFDYVFTTGGIGPTHDDITADAVAKAFQVPIGHHPRAMEILLAYFKEIGREPNEARLRMARTPEGATLIENAVSKAPGFRIGNVFVMAGVPKIMQAMMEAVAPTLDKGVPMQSRTVALQGGEGDVAKPLGEIQTRYSDVFIGSYPFEGVGGFATNLVLRSRVPASLERAEAEVKALAETMTREGKARGWS